MTVCMAVTEYLESDLDKNKVNEILDKMKICSLGKQHASLQTSELTCKGEIFRK